MKTYGGKTITHSSKNLAPWRAKVRDIAILAARQCNISLPIDEPVKITAIFRLPKPKRPSFPLPATKPDLDKLQRAIGDALSPKNGTKILQDDSRIIQWNATKTYVSDRANAGAELLIETTEQD